VLRDHEALGHATLGSRLLFGVALGGFIGILIAELPRFLRERRRRKP
jgi:hypothetical protein